jgi:hypothetical protein
MSLNVEKEEASKLDLGLINGRYRALLFLVEKTKIDETKPFYLTNSRMLEVIKLSLKDVDSYVKKHGKHVIFNDVIKELAILDGLYRTLNTNMYR